MDREHGCANHDTEKPDAGTGQGLNEYHVRSPEIQRIPSGRLLMRVGTFQLASMMTTWPSCHMQYSLNRTGAHADFYNAGAKVAITASYQAHFDGFRELGVDETEADEFLQWPF